MRHAPPPPPRNSRTSLLIIMLGRAPESPPPGSIPLSTVGLCILDYAGIVLLSETHWANEVRSYELSVRCLFFTLLYSIEEYVDYDVHCLYLLSYVMCHQLSLNYGGPKIQSFVSAPISLLSASILFSRHPSHHVLTVSLWVIIHVAMGCYVTLL